jgi:thiamine biosynthesis lipoprotein ApbE
MKTMLILSTILLLTLTSCAERTETVTTTDATGTTTVSTTTAGVDEDAARDAAYETGTALEEAGQEIQEESRPD